MVSAWRKTDEPISQVNMKQSQTPTPREKKNPTDLENRHSSSWAYWQKESKVACRLGKGARDHCWESEKVHSKHVPGEK